MPHLLRHGTPIYKVPSERPVILTSKCRASGEEAITTYFNVLGLTRSARAGLELTTFRSQGGSSTTEPLRPVKSMGRVCFNVNIYKICNCFLLHNTITSKCIYHLMDTFDMSQNRSTWRQRVKFQHFVAFFPHLY